ncbi:primosomal protein N' family DNA-binding protein [Thermodesulfovibrio hydrogeniphilus]
MPYFDVSIPLKLKNLTYYHDIDEDLTGYAVTVPLKNKFYEGIVIKKVDKPPDIDIKPIKTVLGQAYTKRFVDFLLWMSFYYVSEIGSILRLTFFEEITNLLKGKKRRKISSKQLSDMIEEKNFFDSLSVNQETVSKIIQAINQRKYKAFLLHSPNIAYEMKMMLEVCTALCESTSNVEKLSANTNCNGTALFILPEIRDVETMYNLIKDRVNDGVVMLHSNMRPSELFESIEKIMNDNAKIVVGTRFAVFAPIKKLDIIIVSQESSWLYKAEESPKYNLRECALMRGFIDECPVILCSNMPSVSSYFNVIQKKFEFINDFDKIAHPIIKVFRQPLKSVFNPEVTLFLKLHAKDGVLAISPRTGYSLLRCFDCGEVIKCENCGYSMLFRKEDRAIECFRCNIRKDVPISCPSCHSLSLHPIGVGVERLKEELSALFAGKEVSIGELDFEEDELKKIYVAHAGKIQKTYAPKFKYAIFVDFDFFLSIPDYRATENAFAKILSVRHLIKDDGLLFIQTLNLTNNFFRYIRQYSFKDFYIYELNHRREVKFPPFVRLIKLTVTLKRTGSKDILEKLKIFLKSNISGDIIGPLKRSEKEFLFILRSKNKRKLTEETNEAILNLSNFKGMSYKIEIDPVSLL